MNGLLNNTKVRVFVSRREGAGGDKTNSVLLSNVFVNRELLDQSSSSRKALSDSSERLSKIGLRWEEQWQSGISEDLRGLLPGTFQKFGTKDGTVDLL